MRFIQMCNSSVSIDYLSAPVGFLTYLAFPWLRGLHVVLGWFLGAAPAPP